MNAIKIILVANFVLVLSLYTITGTAVAAENEAVTTVSINNTITHLEAALKAVNVNDFGVAQEHMKAARQSAKDIIGGSIEVKAQRGSNALASARRQAQKGDSAGTATSLKEAIEVFKSLHNPSETGSRGGLY
ncbi:MAG: hypothetical protein HOP23_18350 [Methylococcaceae bacterium]|nr:hypothetical protein [Methylococcaceae bacterium]